MADNTTINPGSGGDVIATDDLSGVKYQRVKVNYGADGVANDVTPTVGLPVAQQQSATGTLSSVAGTTSASTQLLASNTSRKGACFFNDSAAVLYLGLNATVTTTSHTVQIPAGGYYELPGSSVYTGVIAGVWASATGNVRITELS